MTTPGSASQSSASPLLSGSARTGRSAVSAVAGVFGAVFLLVGILGFVPGITQNLDTIMFAGHHSEAALLGLFQVSVLHNVVHLLFGVVGLLGFRSRGDRKSTRLNSSHVASSYAVFCLKKKNIKSETERFYIGHCLAMTMNRLFSIVKSLVYR